MCKLFLVEFNTFLSLGVFLDENLIKSKKQRHTWNQHGKLQLVKNVRAKTKSAVILNSACLNSASVI